MRGPVQAVNKPAVPDYSNALDKVWASQVACLASQTQPKIAFISAESDRRWRQACGSGLDANSLV